MSKGMLEGLEVRRERGTSRRNDYSRAWDGQLGEEA